MKIQIGIYLILTKYIPLYSAYIYIYIYILWGWVRFENRILPSEFDPSRKKVQSLISSGPIY